MSQQQADSRYREVVKVTLIGSVVDLLLGIAKIFVGVVGGSQALIADGIHSLSDLATDFLVLYAIKHASRDADEEHPYGHARIETVATVALGVALIVVALGIAYDAISRFDEPQRLLHPGWLALSVATVSIFAKEAIYHYTMVVAKKYRSNMLLANAWHSRSDAISSVIVVVGILGSMAGYDYLDALAATGVALMIAKIGWGLAWNSLRELIDTGLDAEKVRTISAAIRAVNGVSDMHMLRTRQMGGDALVEVHLQVDSRLSVSEGHQIGETVRGKLMNEFEHVSDVTVHIDPENDEQATPCQHLPLRAKVMQHLQSLWKDIDVAKDPVEVSLHYLDGKIDVEITLPMSRFTEMDQMRRVADDLAARVEGDDIIRSVRVKYA